MGRRSKKQNNSRALRNQRDKVDRYTTRPTILFRACPCGEEHHMEHPENASSTSWIPHVPGEGRHPATSLFAIPPFQALQFPVPPQLALSNKLASQRDKPCEACAKCTETGHAKVKSEVLLANGHRIHRGHEHRQS